MNSKEVRERERMKLNGFLFLLPFWRWPQQRALGWMENALKIDKIYELAIIIIIITRPFQWFTYIQYMPQIMMIN